MTVVTSGLQQHLVRDAEGIEHGDLLIGGIFQPVIGDDEQGVHLADELADASLGLEHALAALEAEGLGHHAHGQDALFLGDVGHHGGRAGTGAAAHAGGDEHHIRVLKGLGDVVAVLLGAALAHLGIAAGALAVGQLLTDLELDVRPGGAQHLLVRIDGDEFNALDILLHHMVDHVVSGAADADDLYIHHIVGTGLEIISHGLFLPYTYLHFAF